jgi:hypothetical protein
MACWLRLISLAAMPTTAAPAVKHEYIQQANRRFVRGRPSTRRNQRVRVAASMAVGPR